MCYPKFWFTRKRALDRFAAIGLIKKLAGKGSICQLARCRLAGCSSNPDCLEFNRDPK